MQQILFVAWNDFIVQLRQGSTLVWLLVMPPVFFYFIGTVTGGFSSGAGAATATPVVVVAENPGFMQQQLDLRLRDNNFEPAWTESLDALDGESPPLRTLSIDADLTDKLLAEQPVTALFATEASALTRQSEELRIQRGVYTALADYVTVAVTTASAPDMADLQALNAKPRIWTLAVSPAGQRREIPSGFEQAVPGILVMFTLLILLTSGAALLVIERRQGLLRRLASAPMTRAEVVAGKWGGRMLLAVVQIGVALLFGTLLFRMQWGPDLPMVLAVLAAWAGFCACAGLLLGSLASSDGQAAGLGVLAANLLAALGGCWWPIEVTPAWMQAVQQFTPTGWTMDALHKLISFQSGAASAVPELVTLVVASGVVLYLAVRKFGFVDA